MLSPKPFSGVLSAGEAMALPRPLGAGLSKHGNHEEHEKRSPNHGSSTGSSAGVSKPGTLRIADRNLAFASKGEISPAAFHACEWGRRVG